MINICIGNRVLGEKCSSDNLALMDSWKKVFKTGGGASRWGVGWRGVMGVGEGGSGPQFHWDEHD